MAKYIITIKLDLTITLNAEFDNEQEFNDYWEWLHKTPDEALLNMFEAEDFGAAVENEIVAGDFKIDLKKKVIK